LSELVTDQYENARLKAKEFINAISASEIIFVRGTTEAINLVASTFCRAKIFNNGDEVIISHMEHHANIVPWQLMSDRKQINLKVIPISDSGELDVEFFEKSITEKTKLVSLVHISNTLGTINPVKKIIEVAHSCNIPVMIDGAQAIPHMKVDVQELNADFYAFSGHKVFGPTGIGVLYGKTEFLEMMPPYQGGGGMIRTVNFEKTTFDDIPGKFEAGTPNIAGGIGLGMAVDYINKIGLKNIEEYERQLTKEVFKVLKNTDFIELYGPKENRGPVFSFNVKGIHAHDISSLLDDYGVAVRGGHHCAMPLMKKLGINGSVRASFSIYNTKEELNILVDALEKVRRIFQ